ncbi:MAG: hypothetical protein IID03_11745 [Candidatus Dadabacteria bacterium]|nr:hypothetical protein [Candidatus Dadabacteria bacterium]
MKKLLTITALLIAVTTYSQVTVEGIDINKLNITYCTLIGFNKSLFGQKIIITIDYGQKHKFAQSQLIKDSKGKPIIFNTTIDALNFMEKNGWEYVHNYAITYGNGFIYHFLLRRRK